MSVNAFGLFFQALFLGGSARHHLGFFARSRGVCHAADRPGLALCSEQLVDNLARHASPSLALRVDAVALLVGRCERVGARLVVAAQRVVELFDACVLVVHFAVDVNRPTWLAGLAGLAGLAWLAWLTRLTVLARSCMLVAQQPLDIGNDFARHENLLGAQTDDARRVVDNIWRHLLTSGHVLHPERAQHARLFNQHAADGAAVDIQNVVNLASHFNCFELFELFELLQPL